MFREDLAGKMLRYEVDGAIEEALDIHDSGIDKYVSVVDTYLNLTRVIWNDMKDTTEFTMSDETTNILKYWDALDSSALYHKNKIDAVKFLLEIVGQYVILCVVRGSELS